MANTTYGPSFPGERASESWQLAGIGLALLALGAALVYALQPHRDWKSMTPVLQVPNSASIALESPGPSLHGVHRAA
jgi:hypothetical protein